MKRKDDLILRALDGRLVDENHPLAAGIDPDELRQLDAIAEGLASMETLQAPPGFTESVMVALPERRRSLWTRLKDLLVRPHVIRLNLAWESGLAAGLIVLALSAYSSAPSGAASEPPADLVHTRFTLKAPKAKKVTLAGDFNGWHHDRCPLLKAEAEGIWTITIPLHPGRYKYMFYVDDRRWQTDPMAESYEHDGFGSRNAVVEVQRGERVSA
ncbi:MAG: hypothetical protein V2A77_11355 [Pseudomonadota bacterium]